MKFGYTIIYVPDVDQSLEFYTSAFGFKRKFLHDSGTYGELDTGETTLSFAQNAMAEFNGFEISENAIDTPPAGIEIALVTEDVDAAFSRAIKAGAIALCAPKEKPWGQTVAYLRDLNGVIVELCSPI